jgi:hypothetical protein
VDVAITMAVEAEDAEVEKAEAMVAKATTPPMDQPPPRDPAVETTRSFKGKSSLETMSLRTVSATRPTR